MPNRMIREGILSSDKINKLSWPGEVFFRRLMSVADDFGRYDGRTEIVRAALYPLRLDRVSATDVDKWMAECAEAGLVSCYRVDKKEYMQIEEFGQRLRSKKSKYPGPLTNGSRCPPMAADVRKVRPEEEVETEEEGEGRGSQSTSPDGWEFYPKPESCDDLTQVELGGTVEFIFLLKQSKLTAIRVNEFWAAFKLNLTGEKFYGSRADLLQHFRNWLKGQKFDEPGGKQSKSESSVADQIKAAREKLKT